MPISLSDFENDRGTCRVTYRGMALDRVVYNPSRLDGPLTQEVAAVSQQHGDVAGLALALSELVVEWDLLDDGAMYPLEAARLEQLPTAFLWAVFAAIQADVRPAEDERKNSGAGSRPKGN
jgi:hypothetical protein